MTIPEQAVAGDIKARLLSWCIDWNGAPMFDGEQPRIIPRVRDLRDAADEIERLRLLVGVQRPEDVARALAEVERLNDEINALENQYGRGPFYDAAIRDRLEDLWRRRHDATDAILALPHTGQPQEGWRLVPVEPTLSMTTAALGFKPPDPGWHATTPSHAVREYATEIYKAMLSAAPASPRAEGEPQTSIEYHRQRGAAWDIVDEALIAYREFMLDDDYDATTALKKICDRMEERRALYHPAPPVIAEERTP